MSKYKLILLVLVVPSLACSLTSPPAKNTNAISIQAPSTAQITKNDITSTATPTTCIVTATVLQLRECGGVNCTVKDWLEQGSVLSIQLTVNGWNQVTTPANGSGWVNSKYCGGM